MYMEAYGGATSVAEGIIKKALGSMAAKNELKKAEAKKSQQKSFEGEPQWTPQTAVSEDGISPQSNEKGHDFIQADPNVVKEMNAYEDLMRKKAEESMSSKIESLQGQKIYLQNILDAREQENKSLQDKLGRIQLRK